ncbi:MAG: polysaccharide deacetylase family protein [Nitrosopumilaceae archaeon]|nr:polysaccharide deacetylase family protein [Nitrosopumilaceae archaeon]
MKLVHVGVISTGLVIVTGIGLVLPALIIPHIPENQPVFLSFEINNSYNLPSWCNELTKVIDHHNVQATIFISGKLAEQYPECVADFSNNVEFGSMTYNYVVLPGSDYLLQLDEVRQGKQAIDKIGNIDSKAFKSPYSETDQNIYSLLTRSGIVADFSYVDHYNIFEDGQFVRYDQVLLNDPEDFEETPTQQLVSFSFTNSHSIEEIDERIRELKSYHVDFLSASELIENPITGGSRN